VGLGFFQDGRQHLFASLKNFGNVFAQHVDFFFTKTWEYCPVLLRQVLDKNLRINLFVFRSLLVAKMFVQHLNFFLIFFAKWHAWDKNQIH
jgi:hypothetical protein